MQDVLGELLHSAHILTVIYHDQMGPLVLVKLSLEFVRRALHVLFPLRLEKGQAFAGNDLWVLLLQVFDRGEALVVLGAVELARHRDLDRLRIGSGLRGCHIICL